MKSVLRLFPDVRSRTLAISAIVGGVVLIAVILILLQSALSVVAVRTNEIDDRRSEEAIQGALSLSTQHMSSLVEINSVWDDAVTRVYVPNPDKEWLNASYGALAKSDKDYDGVYVIDASGRILWGQADPVATTQVHISGFGPGFSRLFAAYTSKTGNGAPVAALSRTQAGPAFVGVGLIRPSSSAVVQPKGKPLYLVLTHQLNASLIKGYEQSYGAAGLHLVPQEPASAPHVHLRDSGGAEIGFLTWNARLPGRLAAEAAGPEVRFTLLLIGLMTVGFVVALVIALRRLARLNAAALEAANTDTLTGLPNRRSFLRAMQIRQGEPSIVAFLDLTQFKSLNESCGHLSCDSLLIELASRLLSVSPQQSLVARIGGDLFGLLMWGEGAHAQANGTIESLRAALDSPFWLGDRQVKLTASVGAAGNTAASMPAEDLFRCANAALDFAKAHARGEVIWYDEALDAVLHRELDIETQIRDGLRRHEFEVFYQPIVSADKQVIGGVEALVRWPRRPDGPLGPDQFIAIAEKTGLINDIGVFVLRRACTDMSACPNLRLSVNVSPAQFLDPRFLPNVRKVLRDTGFPASRLELEVTEGYLIDSPQQAISVISGLKALGLSISLDDFGTGYSSIAYLRRYGFDKLKIDKSLCDDIATDPKTAALIAATISLARALDIPVTAEGIETNEQAVMLRLAGCQTLQGYLFGKPQAFVDLQRLISGAPVAARA